MKHFVHNLSGFLLIAFIFIPCSTKSQSFIKTVNAITCNPIPDVNQPPNQELCNGTMTTTVNFSGSEPGTIFNWTNDNPSIGLAASGSGNIASFIATNASNAPVTATITITPELSVPETNTFSNTTPILIPAGQPDVTIGPATPYPSNIVVSGMDGLITKVTVKLNDFSHTFPRDVDVMLVGPEGQNAVIMSDVGGGTPIFNVDIILDDDASNFIQQLVPLVSGSYKPTDLEPGDPFDPPAPVPSGSSALSVFNGSAANGTWSLYVMDDFSEDVGNFNGGWELTITTTNLITCAGTPQNFTYTVNPTPDVINPLVTTGTIGTPFSETFTQSGGAPEVIFSTTSILPEGLTLSSSGVLSGTPEETGTFPIVVSAQDANNCSGTGSNYNLIIGCPQNIDFFDGFESGDYSPTWSVGSGISVAEVTSTNPASGLYRLEGTGGTFSHLNGFSTTISPVTPSVISWDIFPTGNVSTNYFVAGNSSVSATNCVFFIYWQGSTGNIRFVSSMDLSYPATPGQWYHIELRNINWIQHTFDIWVNDALVQAAFPFRSNTQNNISRLHLYNFDNGVGVWDNIQIGSNSTLAIATPSSQTICSGTSIIPIEFSGASPGATYNWSRDNIATATGIAESGTGDISGTLVNTTNEPITVTFTIYADYYGSCAETPFTATVIVNPTPAVTATPESQSICNNTQTNISLSSNVPGTTFTWIIQSTSGSVSGQSADSGNTIAQTLVNTGTSAATVTYRITPTSMAPANCEGPYTDVTITISPSPELTCPGNFTVNSSTDGTGNCSGTAFWNHPSLSPDVCGPVVMNMSIDGESPVAVTPGADFMQMLAVGSHVVTYDVMDGAANSDFCSFTITIVDDELPSAICSNQTYTFNGESEIILNPNDLVLASDNCEIQSISINPLQITPDQVGQMITYTATVLDVNGNSATCTASISVSGLPPGWSQNVNGINCNDGSNIAYNPTNQVWTATSTNCYYDSPFTGDAMAFGQRTLCGNGSITVQVTSITGALGWAGIVMRETNAAGSKKVQLMTNLHSNNTRREVRSITGGQAVPQQFISQGRFWLRIVRQGNQFVAFNSHNGVQWFQLMVANVPMNDCIELGMVVTNYAQNSTVTATFANVSTTGAGLLNVPVPTVSLNEAEYLRTAEFSIYPNPADGEINLNLVDYQGLPVQISIFTLQGQLINQLVMDEVLSNVENMNMSQYPAGMYLITVKSPGIPDVTRRLVIQR